MENTKKGLLTSIFGQVFAFMSVIFGAFGSTVLLFTYMFGVFTDGDTGMGVVEMFKLLINVYFDFTWENFIAIIVGVMFIPSTVVMIKSFVQSLQKFISFLKTYCKKDVAGYVSFCRSMRELICATFMNCFSLVTAGYITIGLEASAATKTALSLLAIGYVFANVGLIFWQKRTPCLGFIISESIRSSMVPLILISICKYAMKPAVLASFGRGCQTFFGNSSILGSADSPEALLYVSSTFFTLIAEPIGWLISWALALALVKATGDKLSNLDRPYTVDSDPLHPAFLSFAIYTSVWTGLKCSAGVFLTQNVFGNLVNMTEGEEILDLFIGVFRDCFELVRYDQLPLIFFCIGTYVLLCVPFDKQNKKLSVAEEKEDLAEAFDEISSSQDTPNEVPVAVPVTAKAPASEEKAVEAEEEKSEKEEAPAPSAPVKAFCRFCGGKIEKGAKFCCNCGAKLD